MCGIVGFIGTKGGSEIVLGGLRALEYRGYDSAGIALLEDGVQPSLIKQVGRVEGLEKAIKNAGLKGKVPLAIGHTRWATHGSPTIHNAHPHANTDESIFVVHNGIIENYAEIRERLQKRGYKFASETDTEVIPHLIDDYFKKYQNFEVAFKAALRDLRGAYAIVAISTHQPDTLFAARLSSPLVVGVGENEFILASDPSAILEHTKKVVYLDDYDVAVLQRDGYAVHNLKNDELIQRTAEVLDFDAEQALLGDTRTLC